MEVELLEQIVKNTTHKTSFQIIVSNDKSNFNTRFNPKLELDRDKVYEIALVNLETYYSFPNIDETNNLFVYSPDNGNSWVKIKIPEGSYKIDDINNTIKHEMEKRGHYDSINEDYYINISANSNTLKSVLILEKDYQVDFNHQNSISKVLGFTVAKYTEGFHESENVVNILRINSILVNIDIISGSYVNGTTKSTIYSFFPKVSPGYKIIESPVNPFPNDNILQWSKLKELADNNFEFDENGRKFSKWVENTVGKGEIARYEQFLLFPQCFQKTCTADT